MHLAGGKIKRNIKSLRQTGGSLLALGPLNSNFKKSVLFRLAKQKRSAAKDSRRAGRLLQLLRAAPVIQAGETAGAIALRQEGAICSDELRESNCVGGQRLKERVTPDSIGG